MRNRQRRGAWVDLGVAGSGRVPGLSLLPAA